VKTIDSTVSDFFALAVTIRPTSHAVGRIRTNSSLVLARLE
jgi:hypothetical protein